MDVRQLTLMCAPFLFVGGLLVQVRDVPARPTAPGTGTASIAGVVVTADAEGRPLRRATVQIGGQGVSGRIVITDDEGAFEMRNLPAGRYQVSASKPAYVAGAYGVSNRASASAALAGTAIALEDGQRVEGIRIALARGAVISGTIRDYDGQPARSVSVRLLSYSRSATTGERTLVSAPHSATTDDRGVYRIYGIRAGEYVLASRPGAGVFTDVRATTDADVRQARAAIERTTAPIAPAAVTMGQGPAVGFVPVFYPGTTIVAQAAPLILAPGEERVGVDLQMQLVGAARIEGHVTTPDGRPAAGAFVRLLTTGPAMTGEFGLGALGISTSAAVGPDGRYRLTGVIPGTYLLYARSSSPAGGSPAEEASWALATLTISGDDITANLAMRRGLALSGRLVFDATSLAPPDPSRARISLSSLSGFGTLTAVMGADPETRGMFTIKGIVPGPYRLLASVPGGPVGRPDWLPRSAAVNGREALDGSLEIGEADDLREMVVTFTDRPAELAGLIVDAAGRPAPEYFLIAFPQDRTLWTAGSRRVQPTRPADDGRFSFLNLPAGEYLLAAASGLEQNQWFDPAFLAELAAAAVKISLQEGERTVQNLQVR